MYPIKLCLDHDSFSAKPIANVIKDISGRIGSCPTQINNRTELEGFIKKVSTQGYTFCPATFSDGHRHQVSFDQQQLVAMDFDNDEPGKAVTFDTVLSRAKYYALHPLFAFNSLQSSPKQHKFRIVFLHDVSVPDPWVALAMQLAMGEIFPETDALCYKDISKIGDLFCKHFPIALEITPGRSTEEDRLNFECLDHFMEALAKCQECYQETEDALAEKVMRPHNAGIDWNYVRTYIRDIRMT